MRRIALPLIFLVPVIASFIVGVFNQTPELMLVWLCLHPFAWFWLGRASLRLHRKRFLTEMNKQEVELLARAKGVR